MRTSSLSLLVAGLALALPGCTGSGGGSSLGLHCGSGASFCLISCDLGCTETGGCSLTQIAENQTLHFIFNQAIDPASVNASSFSLRTATGQSPEGDIFLTGNQLIFVPRITTSAGISRFGFARNETYILTLAGAGSGLSGLKSVSGSPLAHEFTCTLNVTLGIIDLDRSPPRAEMLVPTNLQAAPLDTSIVVRFSELIDTAPFLGASTASIPIRYQLKRARNNGSTLECDPSAQPIQLEGTVRVSVELQGSTPVSVVSMKPSVTLPGLSCVEVLVSGDVRDLAGVAAVPATFQFITAAGVIRDFDLIEDFSTATKMDAVISSGTWGVGGPGARPGVIGGDGRHGSFDATIGTVVGANIYSWSTDNMVIPGNKTLSGAPETVTDGKFYFTDMILPAGTTLRFTGANAPQFFVRGKVDISGRVELNAAAMTGFTARNGFNNTPSNPGYILPGQLGGVGGPYGGRGGNGGERCNGQGPHIVSGVTLNNGQPGQDVHVSGSHAYQTRTPNTGGQGSPLYPPSGLFSNVTTTILGSFNGQILAGGGGGGLNVAGNPGNVQSPLVTGAVPSGPSVGGVLFDMFPYPVASPPPGYSSLLHFLMGGSGGGGGGSHPYGAQVGAPTFANVFAAGAGGSGGGGCMAIRAGNDLSVRASAALEAKGGGGFIFSQGNINEAGLACPGGGGSGGSWVLQSGGNLQVTGALDTSGGGGSRIANVNFSILTPCTDLGGAGSPGFYRLEALGTLGMSTPAPVPTYNASRNSGPLTDRDDVVGCASLWYSTARIFPPEWVHYVLDVDLDGNGTVDQTFSDDPAIAPAPANNLIGPVRIMFQGARVSTTTGLPLQGTTGPWRDFLNAAAGPSNINADGSTGLRMMLQFNRRDFPNTVIKRLQMTYRG